MIEPLKQINFMTEVLGFSNPESYIMRFTKRMRNPDVFTYNHSIEYKEDFYLIEGSFCNCGCKSAVYVKETGWGEESYTEFKTQIEYEKLPNQPKPTNEQIALQTEIILTNRLEEQLGILHGQESCTFIPLPKLIARIPEMS